MPLQSDSIIVIDIEATCWRNNQAPSGEQSEIIEIGVCAYDLATHNPGVPQSILVKPARSKVSPFCTELTSLTQEMVDGGIAFYEACEKLQHDYGTTERVWASWGDYDRAMFAQQCELFGVPYPFSAQHVNLKQVYADLERLSRAVGMAKALRLAKLPLEGTHHRGGDDAGNIARLLAYLVARHGDGFLAEMFR
jgi:inhibitor of KinA sporulation pathway (predicted exonuclease)